jgi:hypothetical protein
MLFSKELFNFFVFDLYISYWFDFQTDYYLNKVSVLSGLFLIAFGTVVFNFNSNELIKIKDIRTPDSFLFYLSMSFFIMCIHFGLSGETIFTSGFGQGELQKSALFEYGIVFFILSLFYVSDSRTQSFFLWVGFVFFVVKILVFGGRVEAIQIGLALIYFNTDFLRSWSFKKTFFLLFLSFCILIVLGSIRTNPMLIFELLEDPLVIFSYEKAFDSGIVSTTYGDVQQASARMVALVDNGFWDLQYRLKAFLSYVFNIFLFGFEFKDLANMAAKDKDIFGAGGGGLIAVQFYVLLGWFGAIFSGLFIGYSLKKGLARDSGSISNVYAFCLLITFPRWYAYGPLSLVKFSLIAVLIFIFFRSISSFLKKKSKA